MAGERVVPILPCPDLPETLAFYTALGFEVTHHQASPYAYACVQRGDIRLDVQVSKGLNPAASPHYCYVSVPDVDALHAGFEAGLLAAYGRPPRRGIPRMGSVNTLSLDRRFTVVDPGGNHLLVGQPRATLSAAQLHPQHKVIVGARTLAYSKQAPEEAARHLDRALARTQGLPPTARFQALVIRADLALSLGDEAGARQFLAQSRVVMPGEAGLEVAADERRLLATLDAHLVTD